MSHSEPARIAARRIRSTILAVLVFVSATLIGVVTAQLVGPSLASPSHGAQYRLCQIYRNEPWHYELRREASRDGCPPMYADPKHDPRMQQ